MKIATPSFMKKFPAILTIAATLTLSASAADIDWAAGIDNGLSLAGGADGTNLAPGSLLRLGYFRDSTTLLQLTDSQILALSSTPSLLNASFVEAASGAVGDGVDATPPLAPLDVPGIAAPGGAPNNRPTPPASRPS